MAFLNKIFSGKKEPQVESPAVEPLIPFYIEGDDRSCQRMTALINRIAENSPTGKAVLTEAAKHCKLVLSSEQLSVGYASCGSETDPQWRIALNPIFSDDVLTSTLVHESRHICQFANGCDEYDLGMLDMKSTIMLDRAMEADADAAAAVAVLELARAGDTLAWEGFEGKRPEVAKALKETLSKNPSASQNELMASAFDGWYDSDRMKTAYEKNYYLERMHTSIFSSHENSWEFDREMSPYLVAKKACLGGYMKTPAQLEEGKFADLNPKTIKFLDKFFKVRELRTGLKPDDSYKTCAVRPAVKEKKNKKKEPVDLSFLQNLAHRRAGRA